MRVSKVRTECFVISFLWLLLAGCAVALPELKRPLAPGEELVTLGTRPGVTVRVLLLIPKTVPQGTFLFFPGSEGYFVNTKGRPRWGYTRFFPELGFITAIVDVPSDQPGGTWAGDRFRTSRAHLEDVTKIIDFINQKWPKPIFLIGHSAGTTSVAYVATVLKDPRIDGIVLTGAPSLLARLPLQSITYPVLFVHHREDTCASFEAAYQQHRRLINSSRVGFLEVLGGEPRGEIRCRRPDPVAVPVDPRQRKDYAHGFSGKESQVVTAITDWLADKAVPEQIGP